MTPTSRRTSAWQRSGGTRRRRPRAASVVAGLTAATVLVLGLPAVSTAAGDGRAAERSRGPAAAESLARGFGVTGSSVARAVRSNGTPVETRGACPVDLPAGEVEGETLVCGTITVPERYDRPAGPTIELAYAIARAESPTPAATAVFPLAGGPGQGATTLLPLRLAPDTAETRLRQTRDIVFLDQRGTGASSPALTCPEVAPDAGVDDLVPALDHCRSRLSSQGTDLSAYTTLASVIDLFVARTVLGYPQVTLYGTSYGAKLAFQAARFSFVDRWIKDVILSSPIAGRPNYLEEQPASFQQAMTNYAEACRADAECAALLPDPAAALDAISAALSEAPETVTFVSAVTGEEKTVEFTATSAAVAVYFGLFLGLLPAITDSLAAAVAGDYAFLATFADFSLAVGDTAATGLLYSVNCAEEWSRVRPRVFDRLVATTQPGIAPLFTGTAVAADVQRRSCDAWNVPPAPRWTFSPVHLRVPALIVSGRFDPITTTRFGEAIQRRAADAIVVEGPVGHDPLPALGSCGADIAEQFVTGGTGAVDATCAAADPVLVFPDQEPADVEADPARMPMPVSEMEVVP